MRTPLIRAGAGTLVALMLLLVALPLTAAAETAKNVANKEEAWFLAKKEPLAELPEGDPTCELPTGCNASGNVTRQPSGHPEGTLVVAANAGEPDAQTFINFDTFALPAGAVITGGTVNLPVARDPDARNANAANAKMIACLVTGFVPDGTDAGSFKDRPTWDDKVCVDVKRVEAEGETADAEAIDFTVDLERFGKEWSNGAFMSGITLMVDPEIEAPAPNETWRVVFNGRRRAEQMTAEEKKNKPKEARIPYPAITSTLQYRVVKLPGFGPVAPPPSTDTGSEDFAPTDTGGGDFSSDTGTTSGTSGGFSGGSGTAAPPGDTGVIDAPAAADPAPVDVPVAADAPAADVPAAAAPAAATQVGTSAAVWIMPVLALAMAGAMAWSLMQPVELAGNREGAVSRLMRTRRLSASSPSSTS